MSSEPTILQHRITIVTNKKLAGVEVIKKDDGPSARHYVIATIEANSSDEAPSIECQTVYQRSPPAERPTRRGSALASPASRIGGGCTARVAPAF